MITAEVDVRVHCVDVAMAIKFSLIVYGKVCSVLFSQPGRSRSGRKRVPVHFQFERRF